MLTYLVQGIRDLKVFRQNVGINRPKIKLVLHVFKMIVSSKLCVIIY